MRFSPPKDWAKDHYCNPRDFLVKLAHIHTLSEFKEAAPNVQNLRGNTLKSTREKWQVALFAHGISSAVLKKEVYLSDLEDEDFDFIARWVDNGTEHYAPIQMKEFVPENLNAHINLNEEMKKLKKYNNSPNLVVVYYLNRRFYYDPNKCDFSYLRFKELWMFGAISEGCTEFKLWGNLLDNPTCYQFSFPALDER